MRHLKLFAVFEMSADLRLLTGAPPECASGDLYANEKCDRSCVSNISDYQGLMDKSQIKDL